MAESVQERIQRVAAARMAAEQQAAGRPGVTMAQPSPMATPDQMAAHPAVQSQRNAQAGVHAAIATGSNQAFLNSMRVPVPTLSGTFQRDEPPPQPGPVQSVSQPPVAAPPRAVAPTPGPQMRTIRSAAGHSVEGYMSGYDNDAGVVRIRTKDGRDIAVPSSLLSDEDANAAYDAPRYTASDKDRADTQARIERRRKWAASQPRRPSATTAPATPDTLADGVRGLQREVRPPAPKQSPVWLTDNTGKHRFEGSVVAHDQNDGVVTIVGADGRPRYVHESRLGRGTLDHVRGLGLPHSEAPKSGVDRANRMTGQPAEGFQRFRLTDGQQVDGKIVSHDPSTNTVKVQTPEGRKVSIDVDSLDDRSRSQYTDRVAEHDERVKFDAEKKAYEDRMGPGSFDIRHGVVTHTDGRSVLTPPNTRTEKRKTAQQKPARPFNEVQPPAPGVPPAAAAVAEEVLRQPPEALANPDEDRFARNAQMRRSDTQTRLRSGQGFANVEQQGPLEDTGLTDAIMDDRARQDGVVRGQLRENVQAQQRGMQRRAEDDRAWADDNPVLAENERRWMQAVRNYREGLAPPDMTLADYAQSQGVNTSLLRTINGRNADARVSAAGKSYDEKVEADTRTRIARNNYRRSRMSPIALREQYEQVLMDPNATPEQKAAAYSGLGEKDLAKQVLLGQAGVAVTEAAAAGDRPPAPQTAHDVVGNAVRSLPPGATVDERISAGAQALMAGDNTMTPEQATHLAREPIQREVLREAMTAPPNSPAFAWVLRTIHRLNQQGAPEVDAQGKPLPRMTRMEFQTYVAVTNPSIGASAAGRLYDRVVMPQFASDDRPAVE